MCASVCLSSGRDPGRGPAIGARMTRWWRTLVFFFLGFLLAAAVSWAVFRSFGSPLPGWVSWAPWVVAAVLVVAHLRGRRGARPIAFLLGMGAQYCVVLALLFLGPPIADRLHRHSFEPAAWQRNSRADFLWPARLTMADDLLASRRLDGLDRAAVVRLLGPAEPGKAFPGWDMVYLLGPQRGLIRIDSEWLAIRFDGAGRVAAAGIVHD